MCRSPLFANFPVLQSTTWNDTLKPYSSKDIFLKFLSNIFFSEAPNLQFYFKRLHHKTHSENYAFLKNSQKQSLHCTKKPCIQIAFSRDFLHKFIYAIQWKQLVNAIWKIFDIISNINHFRFLELSTCLLETCSYIVINGTEKINNSERTYDMWGTVINIIMC